MSTYPVCARPQGAARGALPSARAHGDRVKCAVVRRTCAGQLALAAITARAIRRADPSHMTGGGRTRRNRWDNPVAGSASPQGGGLPFGVTSGGTGRTGRDGRRPASSAGRSVFDESPSSIDSVRSLTDRTSAPQSGAANPSPPSRGSWAPAPGACGPAGLRPGPLRGTPNGSVGCRRRAPGRAPVPVLARSPRRQRHHHHRHLRGHHAR